MAALIRRTSRETSAGTASRLPTLASNSGSTAFSSLPHIMSDSFHSRTSIAVPSRVPPDGQPRLPGCDRFGESTLIACFRDTPVIPQNSSSTFPRPFFLRTASYRRRMIPTYAAFSSFDISIAPFSVSFHLRQPKSRAPRSFFVSVS